MTAPIRLWIAAAYHPAYRCGGWAAIRVGAGETAGLAGGERYTTAMRTALSGLAAALGDMPAIRQGEPAQPVDIQTTSPELAAFALFLASLGAAANPATGPDEDLDLWARIATAAKGRRLNLVHTSLTPGTPIAFAAAWAELARDKAKASGAFTAAIPRLNLAKIPGLPARPTS
jgi:hypothetical protein